jgi:hypothetical protein
MYAEMTDSELAEVVITLQEFIARQASAQAEEPGEPSSAAA